MPIGVESSPNEPADFDNDGKIDVAVSRRPGDGVSILLGAGDGTFSSSQVDLTGDGGRTASPCSTSTATPTSTSSTRIDGDDELALLLNNGNGVFGAPTYFDSGVQPASTAWPRAT